MTSQPVSSIFLHSPLPSSTWQTSGLSIPQCCLHTSRSVFLVFFPLSQYLARRFWPDLMNGRHDPLQVASIYDCQKVFVWSDCLLDLGTDFLVGNNHGLLYEMCSVLRKHLISKACILLCNFSVGIHGSQVFMKMDVTREHISRIFELREVLLSFQTGFSLVSAAVVCAILESISGWNPRHL